MIIKGIIVIKQRIEQIIMSLKLNTNLYRKLRHKFIYKPYGKILVNKVNHF